MNQDLQNLEIKVENEGTTPQGRLTAAEWNILVAAVKSLDLTGGSVDITSILQAVANAGYATQEWVNKQDYATATDFNKFVKDFVTLDTTQAISGIKDFTNGLKIGGLSVYKSQADTIYLDCNLVVRGCITAFGTNKTITASIFEALPIDGITLKRTDNGVLYVASGGSGGTGGGISIADVENYLTTNGYATQDWVTNKGYITSASSITGNAATATKLKNSVSLWGRSFDGSADLTGALTVTTGEGYRINYNGYDLRFIVSGSSSNRGIWDNTNNNWLMYRSGSNDIYFTSGNIGFGTTSPTEKVTVSGNVKSTGHFNSTSANSHYHVNGREVIGSYLNTYFLFDSAPTDGYDTHILGSQIYLKGGAAKTLAMLITSSGNVDVKGKLTLPTGSSNFTNASLWFGEKVRIGANSSNALGLYADYAIRLSPDSATSASTTKGLWLLNSGYNGVNNSSPTEALDVTGNIKASGSLIGKDADVSGALNLTATPSQAFDGAQILFAGGNGRIGASASGFMGLYANTFTFRPSSTISASSSSFTIDANANLATTGKMTLPIGSSNYANASLWFGDSVRIGVNSSNALGIYAGYAIRLNPDSATSASTTKGLWLLNNGYNGVNNGSPTEALDVSGNILATGGITARNSSDRRLKKNIRKFNASKVLMSLGGVYQYEYIASEVQKNHIYVGTHYGLIYQHVVGTKLDVMCHEREDGFGTLNYLHPKFISLIAGATIENISEVEKLKREIRHLEAKVKQLENRV